MRIAEPSLENLCINTIRGLSIDAVQKANSGHPGLPMGAAPMAFALWTRHLRFNPKNPKWFDRDRFILSAGHGSMLLYSLLHLTGYDVSLEDLKQFRQAHSKTPGHPENTLTPGVEMATGPLGQGFAHGVGFAIAEAHLAARYNRPGHEVIDHYTYAIVSDGDLMEGISSEAGSLAGHLQLGKLIYLYDDNGISIDGSTSLAFTEDVNGRFTAFGWHVQRVDGMNVEEVSAALEAAKNVTDKPSLIMCKTVIGFGSPHKAGTAKAHGSPLGPDEVKLTKENLGIPLEPEFYVPAEVAAFMNNACTGDDLEGEWKGKWNAYASAYPAEAAELKAMIDGVLPEGWTSKLPTFTDPAATRKNGLDVLNAVAAVLPGLLGGSADLSESTFTTIHGEASFQPGAYQNRNFCYGVREHAMAAAVNGMTLHGGVKPIASSFVQFTDYCRPSIRLAALMECPSLFVFTHDSIGLGEDGPTHQPIEHLAALRAMPNLNTMRPCDGNETAAAYKVALESTHTPSMLVLTRQNLPVLSPSSVASHPLEKGAYVLVEASSTPKVVLVATGSEVQWCVDAAKTLEGEGIPTRVVSMPSWFLFEKQSSSYQTSVLPKGVPTLAVEAGCSMGWAKYSTDQICIDRFGVSGPAGVLFKEFGFTAENVAARARALLA
ncbi:MAG: transketolase [Armatimonadetes bacterium]|nr:transketolase [Armatimonadota bacterium]